MSGMGMQKMKPNELCGMLHAPFGPHFPHVKGFLHTMSYFFMPGTCFTFTGCFSYIFFRMVMVSCTFQLKISMGWSNQSHVNSSYLFWHAWSASACCYYSISHMVLCNHLDTSKKKKKKRCQHKPGLSSTWDLFPRPQGIPINWKTIKKSRETYLWCSFKDCEFPFQIFIKFQYCCHIATPAKQREKNSVTRQILVKREMVVKCSLVLGSP